MGKLQLICCVLLLIVASTTGRVVQDGYGRYERVEDTYPGSYNFQDYQGERHPSRGEQDDRADYMHYQEYRRRLLHDDANEGKWNERLQDYIRRTTRAEIQKFVESQHDVKDDTDTLFDVLKSDDNKEDAVRREYLDNNMERIKGLIRDDFRTIVGVNDFAHRRDYIRRNTHRLQNFVRQDYEAFKKNRKDYLESSNEKGKETGSVHDVKKEAAPFTGEGGKVAAVQNVEKKDAPVERVQEEGDAPLEAKKEVPGPSPAVIVRVEEKEDSSVSAKDAEKNSVSTAVEKAVEKEDAAAPEKAVEKKDAVTPEEAVEKKDAVTPEKAVEKKDAVTPEEAVEKKDAVTPEKAVEKKDAVTPEEAVEKEVPTATEDVKTEEKKDVAAPITKDAAAPVMNEEEFAALITGEDSAAPITNKDAAAPITKEASKEEVGEKFAYSRDEYEDELETMREKARRDAFNDYQRKIHSRDYQRRVPTLRDYPRRIPTRRDYLRRIPTRRDYVRRIPTRMDYERRIPTRWLHDERSVANNLDVLDEDEKKDNTRSARSYANLFQDEQETGEPEIMSRVL